MRNTADESLTTPIETENNKSDSTGSYRERSGVRMKIKIHADTGTVRAVYADCLLPILRAIGTVQIEIEASA